MRVETLFCTFTNCNSIYSCRKDFEWYENLKQEKDGDTISKNLVLLKIYNKFCNSGWFAQYKLIL